MGFGVQCPAVLHSWSAIPGVVHLRQCAEDWEILVGAGLVYPNCEERAQLGYRHCPRNNAEHVSGKYPPVGAAAGVLYMEEATPNAYFATAVGTLADDLEMQISSFLRSRLDTVLVAIDTHISHCLGSLSAPR